MPIKLITEVPIQKITVKGTNTFKDQSSPFGLRFLPPPFPFPPLLSPSPLPPPLLSPSLLLLLRRLRFLNQAQPKYTLFFKVTRRIVMVGTQERFAKGESYNDPATGRPENSCNATGRQLLWATNGVTYQWETTPVAHMVYYDIRPETFTEQRGYFKIKSGDVIDIVIQDYPACNQVTCCSL